VREHFTVALLGKRQALKVAHASKGSGRLVAYPGGSR